MKRKYFTWEECMNLREVKVTHYMIDIVCWTLKGGKNIFRFLIASHHW